ncbi:MAG: hypothetical protein RLZZ458_1387 [Planctomycetota bacterium]|jgi:hypothetical protein
MKVEDCIVSVERRTFGECLDLAIVFTREFAAPLLRIWLVCAIPSCALVWLLASSNTDMLFPSILIFLVLSSVYNSLLIAAVGPQVFGVPMSLKSGYRLWRRRFFSWLVVSLFARFFQFISGFCFVLPSVIVTAYVGHYPEVLLLEDAPLSKISPRLSWLSSGGGYGRSQARLFGLFAFWAIMSAGTFLALDLSAATLVNRPIFLPLLLAANARFEESMAQIILDDPAFLTALQLALWIPYPIIRIAWFFCYLDQRIRNECWDLQVQLRAEASRLEQLA